MFVGQECPGDGECPVRVCRKCDGVVSVGVFGWEVVFGQFDVAPGECECFADAYAGEEEEVDEVGEVVGFAGAEAWCVDPFADAVSEFWNALEGEDGGFVWGVFGWLGAGERVVAYEVEADESVVGAGEDIAEYAGLAGCGVFDVADEVFCLLWGDACGVVCGKRVVFEVAVECAGVGAVGLFFDVVAFKVGVDGLDGFLVEGGGVCAFGAGAFHCVVDAGSGLLFVFASGAEALDVAVEVAVAHGGDVGAFAGAVGDGDFSELAGLECFLCHVCVLVFCGLLRGFSTGLYVG